MNSDDIGKLFTTNGEDVWRMITYCEYPTATFINLDTGREIGGAVGSPILNQFKKLRQKSGVTNVEKKESS